MLYKIKNRTISFSDAANENNKDSDGTRKYVLPPFLMDTVNRTVAHKVGNTKTWKETVWNYCDFTNHRYDMNWHKHKATNFKSHLRRL